MKETVRDFLVGNIKTIIEDILFTFTDEVNYDTCEKILACLGILIRHGGNDADPKCSSFKKSLAEELDLVITSSMIIKKPEYLVRICQLYFNNCIYMREKNHPLLSKEIEQKLGDIVRITDEIINQSWYEVLKPSFKWYIREFIMTLMIEKTKFILVKSTNVIVPLLALQRVNKNLNTALTLIEIKKFLIDYAIHVVLPGLLTDKIHELEGRLYLDKKLLTPSESQTLLTILETKDHVVRKEAIVQLLPTLKLVSMEAGAKIPSITSIKPKDKKDKDKDKDKDHDKHKDKDKDQDKQDNIAKPAKIPIQTIERLDEDLKSHRYSVLVSLKLLEIISKFLNIIVTNKTFTYSKPDFSSITINGVTVKHQDEEENETLKVKKGNESISKPVN